MPELDAVLTLSERSLGVMQPRPATTLHVGGPITADGLLKANAGLHVNGPITTEGGGLTLGDITASSLTVTPGATSLKNTTVTGTLGVTGDINGYYLQSSDGSNGIVRSGAGSLYVRGANAHVYVDGAGGLHVSGGPLDVATGMTLTNGKLDLYKASTPLAYHSMNIEVRAPTPNQPGIGFHESGSTATTIYKKAGTEELWERYNSGTVDARLLHNGEVGTGGNQIVRRDGNGYIFGNYINMTADVQPGAPAYVAGQGGDGYLRWYPKSVVATTTSIGGSCGQIDLYDGNGWVEVNRLTAPRSGQGHVSATYRVARANGTYVSQAYCYLRLHFHNVTYIQSEIAGVPNGGDDRDGMVAVHWTGQIGAGQICALEVYGGSCCGNFVRLHTGNITMTVGTN